MISKQFVQFVRVFFCSSVIGREFLQPILFLLGGQKNRENHSMFVEGTPVLAGYPSREVPSRPAQLNIESLLTTWHAEKIHMISFCGVLIEV